MVQQGGKKARFPPPKYPTSASQTCLHFHFALRFLHLNTRTYVRLLGPCFKTGRLNPFCQASLTCDDVRMRARLQRFPRTWHSAPVPKRVSSQQTHRAQPRHRSRRSSVCSWCVAHSSHGQRSYITLPLPGKKEKPPSLCPFPASQTDADQPMAEVPHP